MAPPPPPSWVDFVVSVIEKLKVLCYELSNEDQHRVFYSSFRAELLLVQEWLESQPRPLDAQTTVRLSKVLTNLERLSKWPSNSKQNKFTRLAAKLKTSSPYPGLSQLLKSPARAKQCLREFATREPQARQQAFLRTLKRCSNRGRSWSVEETTVMSVKPLPTQDMDTMDYTYHAQSLYGAISKHGVCPSADASGSTFILPHLRLSACRDSTAKDVTFNIFFLGHPHSSAAERICQWQATRISVMRSVSFLDDPLRESDHSPSRIVESGGFCDFISNPQNVGVEISMSLTDGKLVLREFCLQQSSFLLHMPSVSLSQLLEGQKLSRKMRLLLCYMLAKTVWQFYESEWIDREWTKDNIHFMFEHRQGVSSAGIFVNEPFLSARFHQKPDDAEASRRLHMFPKILALGIILLEIELGVDITKERPRTCFATDGKLTVNGNLIAAYFWFQKQELWDKQETFKDLIAAVHRCLWPSLFEGKDTSAQREVLHKQIVLPLQAQFRNSWGDPDEVALRPLQFSPSNSKPAIDSSRPPHQLVGISSSNWLQTHPIDTYV
ncbi:hypothetical protein B0T26DRAFT_432907 [Lasiosphaeria miniovina]|uniref:DUF7580 domain-containing protein n=1 Tax=Lasiosphaeria miniovina TaxID=1954250 RepID=A0AA40DQV0_9PEZI|nr:uncharacterized protein B0T26DRAFT_432907 [Lasiosphaeria miniovina]KAK0710121.1 hypothetical protein B0T26DRAFT_432907 [Lasiosphaeria miniovina]